MKSRKVGGVRGGGVRGTAAAILEADDGVAGGERQVALRRR